MFYVYILQRLEDLSYYVGQCDDLDRRMSKHFDGISKYTASKGPLRLRYFEKYSTRTEALRRENEIKKYKSRKQLFIAWIDSDSPWFRETFDP